MPVKIFHGDSRDQELLGLENEINRFEQQLHQLHDEGKGINYITSSITYECKLVTIVYYGPISRGENNTL